MKSMLPFLIIYFGLTGQRLIELAIARKNEKWMKQQGASEFGAKHYKYMVTIHLLFFIFLIAEKIILNRGVSSFWPFFLAVFLLAQCLRIWTISSLGKYWNTKIIVLADAKVIRKGPYRFIKHPNYCVVTIELLVVPLLFSCFMTAILFSCLNVLILSIRIPAEEKALKECTEYVGTFENCNRFIPKIVK
jgi:methyltransferase